MSLAFIETSVSVSNQNLCAFGLLITSAGRSSERLTKKGKKSKADACVMINFAVNSPRDVSGN